MNKTILLLLITSSLALAGEQDGTGNESNNTTSNGTVYQLVCTTATEEQDPTTNCVWVEVPTEN